MARYNPVFAPWIATIRSPTGIKLNCAKLGSKVGKREIGYDKERKESEIVKSNYNSDRVFFSVFIVVTAAANRVTKTKRIGPKWRRRGRTIAVQ